MNFETENWHDWHSTVSGTQYTIILFSNGNIWNIYKHCKVVSFSSPAFSTLDYIKYLYVQIIKTIDGLGPCIYYNRCLLAKEDVENLFIILLCHMYPMLLKVSTSTLKKLIWISSWFTTRNVWFFPLKGSWDFNKCQWVKNRLTFKESLCVLISSNIVELCWISSGAYSS